MTREEFGDGVRVVCAQSVREDPRTKKGMRATIKKCKEGAWDCYLEFDEEMNGHNAGGKGKNNRCLYFYMPRHKESRCQYPYCLCHFDVIPSYSWRKL